MAKLKIRWSIRATLELNKILIFYNVRNGNNKYSRSIMTMIRDCLKLVSKYPYMYQATTVKETRAFVCEYFKIYYSVHEDYVEVEAVFDTRQDPEKRPY